MATALQSKDHRDLLAIIDKLRSQASTAMSIYPRSSSVATNPRARESAGAIELGHRIARLRQQSGRERGGNRWTRTDSIVSRLTVTKLATLQTWYCELFPFYVFSPTSLFSFAQRIFVCVITFDAAWEQPATEARLWRT